MNAYFDAAYFWGCAPHIMSLSIGELSVWLQQANRIEAARKP